MKKILTLSVLMLLFAGCTTTKPAKTSLELQAFQAKEFDTTKKIAFSSVLSVFQDLGYIVGSADLETGFITAKSPTKAGFVPFVGNVMTQVNATGFVEPTASGRTRVRLNFVQGKESSSGYGMKSSQDKPIEDPAVYQNAFTKIQEAIFIRSGTQ